MVATLFILKILFESIAIINNLYVLLVIKKNRQPAEGVIYSDAGVQPGAYGVMIGISQSPYRECKNKTVSYLLCYHNH